MRERIKKTGRLKGKETKKKLMSVREIGTQWQTKRPEKPLQSKNKRTLGLTRSEAGVKEAKEDCVLRSGRMEIQAQGQKFLGKDKMGENEENANEDGTWLEM